MEGHVSVLLKESIEAMNLSSGMVVVDGTLGGGGHTEEILKKVLPKGIVIGIDKDIEAIKRVSEHLKEYKNNLILVHDDFKNIKNILRSNNIESIDAAILDLGVSSFQLDDETRGFSYQKNAELDMRMNEESSLSALEVVNTYSERELERIIREYGEERWASRIAKFIVSNRKENQIRTTEDLNQVIKAAIPKGARKDGPHPSKRTFQAIRIEVNKELTGLDKACEDFADCLKPNGRLAVITFHSLEDRIIKQTFNKLKNPCTCPPDAPICICGKKPIANLVVRKAIIPSEEEIQINPRSRSAKLRVIEKI